LKIGRKVLNLRFHCREVEKLTAQKPAAGALANGPQNEVVDDYGLFKPLDYLTEYHTHWDVEDDCSSRFIHKTFQSIEAQQSLIDIGGGPTLYQFIAARNKVSTITFAEYLECNRREVEKWQKNEPDAFNWDPYFEYYLQLEKGAHHSTIADMKSCLRSKKWDFVPCDLHGSPPIPGPERTFDIVSSHYCVEAICKNDADLGSKLSKLVALSRPGGYLIMSVIKDADCYQVGDFNFYAYPISVEKCQTALKGLGCKILDLDISPVEPGRNYGGMFCLFAKKAD
jgi:NNMT/PNMT/TEMT family